MAKVYAAQGYLRKAAAIYRRLAALQPERDDLQKALTDIERRIAELPAPTRKDTELLLREWIDMLKAARRRHADKPTQRNGRTDQGARARHDHGEW
jgi:hypothetical protein